MMVVVVVEVRDDVRTAQALGKRLGLTQLNSRCADSFLLGTLKPQPLWQPPLLKLEEDPHQHPALQLHPADVRMHYGVCECPVCDSHYADRWTEAPFVAHVLAVFPDPCSIIWPCSSLRCVRCLQMNAAELRYVSV